MKWYWAILITLAIMIAVGMLAEEAAASLAMLVSAISAIAIAAHGRSWGWGLFVLFLWPIGFPCYLIAQGAEVSAQDQGFSSTNGQRGETSGQGRPFVGQERAFTAEVPGGYEPGLESAVLPVVGLLIVVGLVGALLVYAVCVR